MKKFILLLAAVALLTSCATRREQTKINYWHNRSKVELISEWGPPTSSSSYGHGIEVLNYKRNVNYTDPAPGKPSTHGAGNLNQFYVSSSGTICYILQESQ